MWKNLASLLAVVFVLNVAPMFAQKELTLKGEIVDTVCYLQKGAAEGTGARHIACAKDCASKGKVLGVLTDGEGLVKFINLSKENRAKLVAHLGRTIEVVAATPKIPPPTGYGAKQLEFVRIIPTKKDS